MTDKIIETVLHWLEAIFVRRELVVTFIAILPIVEARMAIPIAFGYKLGVFQSWLFSFIGSSLMAPLLLLILIPLIKWLSNTRVFRKLGQTLYDKFESKAKTVKTDESETNAKKREFKKALGVFVFVAIPLPLTGVWTGSAVASILKLRYPAALAAVVAGNAVASGIILLLCVFFAEYVNIIILALAVIALIVVIVLIVKVILHKSPDETVTENANENKPE